MYVFVLIVLVLQCRLYVQFFSFLCHGVYFTHTNTKLVRLIRTSSLFLAFVFIVTRPLNAVSDKYIVLNWRITLLTVSNGC